MATKKIEKNKMTLNFIIAPSFIKRYNVYVACQRLFYEI